MDLQAKDIEAIITAYNEKQSLNNIAKVFKTYPTTIQHILEKNGVELRHDKIKKGDLCVKDGEKLIEWAKAQKRLVTKSELAKVIGKKRLSPSYFLKYPELGKYVVRREQKELTEYSEKLYAWLQKNNITYKPNDKLKLGVTVTALLLGDYNSNTALQINIKPACVSRKNYSNKITKQMAKAKEIGVRLIYVNEDDFDIGLESLKDLLLSSKK